MAKDIMLPVGENCPNSPQDVRTIADMLNFITPDKGGTDNETRLPTDGRANAEFVNALHKFQSKYMNLGHEYAKVMPGGLTMAKLNECMYPPPISKTSRMMCMHGGQAQVLNTGKASPFDPFLNLQSTVIVTGCPHMMPMGPSMMPSPCTRVQWLSAPTPNFLDQGATGLCLTASGMPQGNVIILTT